MRDQTERVASVEELILAFEEASPGCENVSLWVADTLTIAGQVVQFDVGMAVLLDRILALEFEPAGFTPGRGGRTYHYRRWE